MNKNPQLKKKGKCMKVAILADNNTMQFEAKEIAEAFLKAEHQAELVNVDDQPVATLQAIRPDICCIASGTKGSNGALQELCELLQLPYLGSQPEACKLCTDDQISMFAMQRYAEASEVDVIGDSLVSFTFSSDVLTAEKEILVRLCEERIPGGYPFEVKPLKGFACERNKNLQSSSDSQNEDIQSTGNIQNAASEMANNAQHRKTQPSSAETILVNSSEELLAALAAFESSGCKVAQWVEGARLSVVVLGTGWNAHVLPPVEEVPAGDSLELISPVRLKSLHAADRMTQSIRSEIERFAFEACLSLGVRDFAIVHVVWDGAQVRFAGVDTAPSMAASSVFAQACKAVSLSIEGVLDFLVSL